MISAKTGAGENDAGYNAESTTELKFQPAEDEERLPQDEGVYDDVGHESLP